MALQSSSLFAWVPNVEMKKDPKQMTFDIPHCLMPLTRQIFYRRYVCDVAGTAGYQVYWLDEGTNPTRTIHVEDSNDISIVPTDLPSQDLFRTKIQVNCDNVKLVTITIFYSTGTVLVQGNRCPRWRDEEFSSLIKCIRAIYAFVDRVKEPELHETVTTNLRNLRLPTVSPSPTGEPGLHDVRPRCSPRPQLPRTTGSTRRSSRRLQALSPKSASPSAAPVPVSQQIKPTRHLDHTRATPPTTPRQPATPHQPAYPVTPSPHHASLVTELETAKQQIKAELKLHVKVKFDQLTDTVTSLSQKLTEVTKQNKDMKSQIGDLRKYISVIKTGLAKQQTPAAAEIQEPSAPKFPVNNNNTSANVETSNMFSVLSGGEDDQLDNCPSSSLDAATTYNTDPSHDSTIDNHDSTPPLNAPPPNHTDRDARTTRDSPPIRSTSTRPSPRHTDRDARTPRERMAECRVSPGKTHVLIGDSVFGQIRPELMYPHKAQQKISISGLTVDDLLHWLQNVPKCRDVQLLVVHVGVNTCWVNTVTESMWRALLKLLKSVFPNAVVQLSSLIPPQGEHPLRKTVAASNATLVKACHSEQVMLADHTDTFTTNSGAPRKALYRDALHPSPKGTVRLACNVKYMYVGQPRPPLRPQERPSHPSPSASGRVPLLETPSFQPRFDCPPSQHLREGGGRSQQYRNGPAVSTTRGPFPPPPLLQQRPADTESSIPQRRLGDAPLHHQPHRYSRGTPQHRDVGTAPPPFSGWYRAHRHTLRRWAAPPPQSSYGALPPRGRQCTYGPTAHPSFNTQQASIVLHPHRTSYWGGGGGGAAETLV